MPIVYDEEGFIPILTEVVAEFPEIGSADLAASLLKTELVHAKVDPSSPLAGIGATYRVLVDRRQLHRARWILQDSDLSEAELTYLATGELNPDSD